MKFTDLKINNDLLDAISYMGFENTTPIQEQAIPEILKGRDLIASAQTGTGKTAAFIIPILDRIIHESHEGISTLVIVPTRELSIQIDQQIQGLAYFANINSIAIYGGGDGKDWDQQRKALESGSGMVIATPGKLLAHLEMGYVKFDSIQYLILDEADRMLDMGFYEDIQKIISYLPKQRQSLMFSATMPDAIRKMARQILKDPVEINIALSKPASGILQCAYLAYENQKTELINHLIKDKTDYPSILIFCSTKQKVNDLYRRLKKSGENAEFISSDLKQEEREKVLLKFKASKIRTLVATDVLSRGIDIKGIDLIINYDVPQDAEDYVHRVGRTARASLTGVAITLVNEQDMLRFKNIEKLIGTEILKLPVPDDLGESPAWNTRSKSGRKFGKRKK